MRTVFPSAISTYMCCPQMYHYRYVDRLAAISSETHASQIGQRIHNWLHRHVTGLPVFPEHMSGSERAMWEFYLSYVQGLKGDTIGSEWDFHVPYEVDGEKIILTGRIDRLMANDDYLLVLDWKTGSLNSGTSRYQIQMEFYTWALWKMQSFFKDRRICYIEARLVSLKDQKDSIQQFQPEDIERLETKFMPVLARMNTDKYRCLPNPLIRKDGTTYCQVCQFQRICPEVTTT